MLVARSFLGGRSIAQRGMRPHFVVVPAPALDQNLCLMQRREQFACQQFVAELGIETLAVTVLPR
jgi:hypothetical protein